MASMTLFRPEAIAHASRRLTGEVVLATPLPLIIYTSLCVIVLAGALAFASVATYARQEQVSGWLVPEGGFIRVTARSAGVLNRLLVKEGQSVKAGQPVAEQRLSNAMSNGRDAGMANEVALQAESRANAQSAEANVAKLRTQQAQLVLKVGDLSRQLSEIRDEITNQQRQVKLYEKDAARFKRLADSGIVAVRQADQAETALLSAQQSLSQLRATSFGTQQQLEEASAGLSSIPSEIAVAEASARASEAQIDERRIQNSTQSVIILTASVSGRVTAIPVEQGQVLSAGQTVAIVMASGAKLFAELYAPSTAIGSLKTGQNIHLMYQAFPYEKFGTSPATLTSISHTILAPNEVQLPGYNSQSPAFRVRAQIASQMEHAYGEDVPLQPGMLLSAHIIADQRTLLQWLFDPLYAIRR